MGDISDNVCKFLGRYVSNHFSKIPLGQGITMLVRNTSFSYWCQSCLWAPNMGLKLKFLQELNSEPSFEQVTPSRSWGKEVKAWGQICLPGSWRIRTRVLNRQVGPKGMYKVQNMTDLIGLKRRFAHDDYMMMMVIWVGFSSCNFYTNHLYRSFV